MVRERDEDDPVENAIWDRMDLAAGNILGIKDRIRYLEVEDASRLRGVVLRELNEFAEFCVSLVRVSSGDDTVNELVIEMLKEIHSAVVPCITAGPG